MAQSVTARAKINLFLHAGDKRDDGFHPLQSLAVFPDFGDTLTAEAADGLSLSVTGPFGAALAGEADNLVLKAARALAAKAGCAAAANITLVKNLPLASGIGGGSADAAAALRALSALWSLDLDDAALGEVGASLGSDIPVCVASQPRWMEGRGEILGPVASMPHLPLLLVNPGIAVPTAGVFAALQARSGVARQLPPGRFSDMADLLRFMDSTKNDLEAPARGLFPQIGEVLTALAGLPGALFTRMSGSGATCFALFPDDESCKRGGTILSKVKSGWWIQPTSVPEFGIEHENPGQDIGPTDQGL
jgi:4-diphosphocytidyl-2-C-methyl-D-erythritol kinase